MRVRTSYSQILSLSAPIMLGSAVQNVIALTDSVFLYHLSETDFAAIGFVGVFYLVVAAIGYGFSKGGQIMIARRHGEGEVEETGRIFYALVYYELALALVMFLFMQYGCPYFFNLIIDSEAIYTKSLDYLDTRSWGVFFSYVGVAVIALYTGVARPLFIVIDTLVLAVVNILLNYALIFGNWGLPEMGIAGAGLASTIAEVVAFVVFLVYIGLFDRRYARKYRLFRLPTIDISLIKKQLAISAPIVLQAIVGLGSWLIFFSIIENLGVRELAISNLIRMVYLVLSIPTWGFTSGVNTMVSNLIGQRKRQAVLPITWKTARLGLLITLVITLPVVLFPGTVLYPLIGDSDPLIIQESQPIFYILLLIVCFAALAGVFFNALAGTGATLYGLKIQFWTVVVYLVAIQLVVNYWELGLAWAWSVELFYQIFLWLFSWRYLYSKRWHKLRL